MTRFLKNQVLQKTAILINNSKRRSRTSHPTSKFVFGENFGFCGVTDTIFLDSINWVVREKPSASCINEKLIFNAKDRSKIFRFLYNHVWWVKGVRWALFGGLSAKIKKKSKKIIRQNIVKICIWRVKKIFFLVGRKKNLKGKHRKKRLFAEKKFCQKNENFSKEK